MPAAARYTDESSGPSTDCGCERGKVRAIHAYLKEHFPDYTLRDFHAPTRLLHAGLPVGSGEHHVVSLSRDDVLPYQAIFLGEFQENRLDDIEAQLRQWKVADALRAHRIVIVSQKGPSSL